MDTPSAAVVDAAALVEYLLVTDRSAWVARQLEAPEVDLHVPAHCDLEVAEGLRRALRVTRLTEPRALEALVDYLDLPLTHHGHKSLLLRIFALREDLTSSDAAYIALAEELRAPLITVDRRLARAARAYVDVLAP